MHDAADIVLSNPVTKLDIIENGLTRRGQQQVAEGAAASLRSMGLDASATMWFSTWGKSLQTATILGEKLGIVAEQRLPEFSLLDSRGMGQFEGTPLARATEELHAMDAASSAEGPPPITDVTLRVGEGPEHPRAADDQHHGNHRRGPRRGGRGRDSDLLSVWQAAVAGAPLEGIRPSQGVGRRACSSTRSATAPTRGTASPRRRGRRPSRRAWPRR